MMKTLLKMAFAATLLFGACSKAPESADNPPPAPAPISGKLEVSAPWAAVTPSGAKVGAGYLTLTNTGAADKLLGVASPRAKKVEVHEMKMDGAMMSMRPVATLDVPAGATVTFAPGAYHLMFVDIGAPFVEGESIPVTLTFEKAGAIDVALTVSTTPPTAAAAPSGDMGGMKMEGH